MTAEQRKISFELTRLMSRTKNEDARKRLTCALAAYQNWVNHGVETVSVEAVELEKELLIINQK